MKPQFITVMQKAARDVDQMLEKLLPAVESHIMAPPMWHAMMSGGKRLRAFLVISGAHLYGVQPIQALRAGAAVEAMHAYSLVHDDLPAIDNDDIRRGAPTVHVKWDDATAILTGDALQSFSFEILAGVNTAPDPAIRLRLIAELAIACGAQGMVLGQALDIKAETQQKSMDIQQVSEIQTNKTGALFEWAARAGPNLANSNTDLLAAYAKALGLAYQIRDDVLDIEGNAAQAGKRLRKDQQAGKATFVALLGLRDAKRKAKELVDEAVDTLSPFGAGADNLRQLAHFAIQRKK